MNDDKTIFFNNPVPEFTTVRNTSTFIVTFKLITERDIKTARREQRARVIQLFFNKVARGCIIYNMLMWRSNCIMLQIYLNNKREANSL